MSWKSPEDDHKVREISPVGGGVYGWKDLLNSQQA